jgi:hypothetical protein
MSKSNVAVLSPVASRAITQWSGKAVAADKGKSTMVEALRADGIVADDLVIAKGAKEPTAIVKAVKDAIVAGFTPGVQGLLKKDTKTLSDVLKSDKRYWQQQIGSKLKDVRNALKTKENGAGGQRTLKELINAEVTKRMGQVKEDAKPNYDPVELLNALALVAKLTN